MIQMARQNQLKWFEVAFDSRYLVLDILTADGVGVQKNAGHNG